jgi:hypothetical protein
MSDILDKADPLLCNAIKLEVKSVFAQLKEINIEHKQLYEVDSIWLNDSLDKLILCLQARRIASRDEIELDDTVERKLFIHKCAEAITNQLVEIIKDSIAPPPKAKLG